MALHLHSLRALRSLAVQGETRHEAIDKAAQHIEDWHPDAADNLTLGDLSARIDEV